MIVTVLALSVLGCTGGLFVLVQHIFDAFEPSLRRDLNWKTTRLAQELALATDLGLALDDGELIRRAFDPHTRLEDVLAIVAVDRSGKELAMHGRPPGPLEALFAGSPLDVHAGPTYLVAWAGAVIEGNVVGKVAIVISTRRLAEAQILLRRARWAIAGSGLLSLLGGVLFINVFTRGIARRDAQLATYASGLEDKVAERTAELNRMNLGMSLVLDNVDQGFIVVNLDGVMSPERSKIVDRWFGPAAPETRFADYIEPLAPAEAEWFRLGLLAVADRRMPSELVLDQLPKVITVGERTLSLVYTLFSAHVLTHGADKVDQLLVVISDVTDQIARERIERDTREMTRIFQRTARDRVGTDQFFAEADELVRQLVNGTDGGAGGSADRRLVHTLKGNCGLFGLESMTEVCHQVESRMQEEGGSPNDADRRRIAAQWARVSNLTRGWTGARQAAVELDEGDLSALSHALETRAPHEEIQALVQSWRRESIALRLQRLADSASDLAARLEKPGLVVTVEASGIRLDAGRWSRFWVALSHVINNAVDHGIEPPAERLARHKPAAGSLWLTAQREGAELVVSVRDDGRGVDWERLDARAEQRGLPHGTQVERIEAMFADGITTRDVVSEASGRGVGLAALREALSELGGQAAVQSAPGAGTTFSFRFGRAAFTAGTAGPGNQTTAA
jgi:two-component system chemotaxis sensor kinase CheA